MMGKISKLAIGAAIVVEACCAQIEPGIALTELSQAIRMLGNLSSQVGISESKQDLFGRQTCSQGYGRCNYVGDCCFAGPNCCGNICIGLYPGSACCENYICPPDWKCCGTTGSHCAPTSATCCTTDGRYCPANWSCCGDQGYCYPTVGFHCCSNDGSFCADGSKCVYCNGSSGEICCQGANGAIIPPYSNTNPTVTTIPAQPSNTGPLTSQQPIPTMSQPPPTSVPVSQYYYTTFTYTYTVWTRITYFQSVADSTISTTFTILSCLATDPAAAAPTLLSLASSVESSANRSAIAARPASTINAATAITTAATAGVVPTGARSSAPESVRWNWALLAGVIFLMMVGML